MSNLAYLGIAVVLSVAGWTYLWLRHRRPSSTEASVREFSKELNALAPPDARRNREPGRSDIRGRRSG